MCYPRWPTGSRRQGTVLLHQQCWCWGKDILCSTGNLLLAHGFTQYRPPEDSKGSTRYQLALSSILSLYLWGFGLCVRDSQKGAIYLNRYHFAPLWAPDRDLSPDYCRPDQMTRFQSPATAEEEAHSYFLAAVAFIWIAEYETKLLDSLGTGIVSTPCKTGISLRSFHTLCQANGEESPSSFIGSAPAARSAQKWTAGIKRDGGLGPSQSQPIMNRL